MKKIIVLMVATLCLGWYGSSHAGELIMAPEKIVRAGSGQVPQAPRVSPDGKQLVYENYSKEKTTLWCAAADGKAAHCLTCEGALALLSLENGSWHPSGKYLVFNEVPEGNFKQKGIYVAGITDGKLGPATNITQGARPQFSKPNGNVIFFETTDKLQGYENNVLAYQILGRDPLHPAEDKSVELRGPIQQVNRGAEISHPSLAPDGATIIFAARTTNIQSQQQGGVVLNDVDRQKIYKLWKELLKVDKKKINQELKGLSVENMQSVPQIGSQWDMVRDDFEAILAQEQVLAQPSFVTGYTKRHLFLAWVVGLLDMLDIQQDQKVQEMIFPRLWTTDVFGAPVVPLVKDVSSTSLPQKWPTASSNGKFVVFEAGLYSNRHIYLVAKKQDSLAEKAAKMVGIKQEEAWMNRAIKITEKGSYNSSPELDPSGEWLYFESNRDGSKGIWRAKLNWPEINKQLGL